MRDREAELREIEKVLLELEADGIIERTGEVRDGRPVYRSLIYEVTPPTG